MSLVYSSTGVDFRLEGAVAAIDGGSGNTGNRNGRLKLFAGPDLVASFELGVPCGAVANGILSFGGTLIDTAAIGNPHPVNSGAVYNSDGAIIVSGLTAGLSSQSADVVLSAPIINAGQVVQVISFQITGA